MRTDRRRIIELLQGGSRFLLASHVNPDGDSIASQCALRLALERLGKRADVVNSQPVPRVYRFLPGAGAFRTTRPRPWSAYDALIVLDCGDARRASGQLDARPPVTVVNIDHHATNPGFGDLNWVVPAASSTCEVVHDLVTGLGVRPDGGIGEAIYTGILTDTGSFRHRNASPRALRIASRLVDAGVDPSRVARAVYESFEFTTLHALGETLAGMRRSPDGAVVWIRLPRRLLAGLASAAEAEEWASYPRSVVGARVAICFKETGPGEVRLSFRSAGDVDVAALAARFGGGGHRAAAGATAHGPLARVERTVVAAAAAAIATADETPARAARPPSKTANARRARAAH